MRFPVWGLAIALSFVRLDAQTQPNLVISGTVQDETGAVFNAAQVDGYTPMPETARPMPERVAYADMFFKAIGADVSHSGERAYYAHATDPIQMPPFAAFTENVAYYSTWHTNRRIGPRTPRAVIGSWGNDSAIWRMGLRSSSQS